MNSDWRDEEKEINETPHRVLILPAVRNFSISEFRWRRPQQCHQVEESTGVGQEKAKCHGRGAAFRIFVQEKTGKKDDRQKGGKCCERNKRYFD